MTQMTPITLLLAFSLASGAAYAQAPAAPAVTTTQVDARFASWLGCWRLEDDLAGTGARLCLTPDNGGVRLATIVGQVAGAEEHLTADGVARPIVDAECKGTERAEWSRDGLRMFRHTDVTCGSEMPRKVASIAFVSGASFTNVQLVEGGGNRSVRVQRYRRAADQTLADGTRIRVGAPSTRVALPGDDAWNIEDVIEASGKVPAEAVQAAVAESKSRFVVNKRSLVAMADAGVSASVIDLMIGLAFPQRFVVERRGGGGGSEAPVGISVGGGYYDPFLSPLMTSGMYADCYGYNAWGYRSYYYSMCGPYSPYATYGYYGYGGYGGYYPYYPGGGWVVVDPNPPGVGVPAAEGRVVNGRGYTQVRPRDSEPAPIRTGNNGNGTSAGYSGASSGGASSQGYSGGSSGGTSNGGSGSGGESGVRTAVPRPPGGGL